jgi:hypothetical protein
VKCTGLAITQEINRLPRENTVSYSRVGKYVRMFVLSMKETDNPIVPNRKVISVLTPASPLCLPQGMHERCQFMGYFGGFWIY